jgi:hypothetical protein
MRLPYLVLKLFFRTYEIYPWQGLTMPPNDFNEWYSTDPLKNRKTLYAKVPLSSFESLRATRYIVTNKELYDEWKIGNKRYYGG